MARSILALAALAATAVAHDFVVVVDDTEVAVDAAGNDNDELDAQLAALKPAVGAERASAIAAGTANKLDEAVGDDAEVAAEQAPALKIDPTGVKVSFFNDKTRHMAGARFSGGRVTTPLPPMEKRVALVTAISKNGVAVATIKSGELALSTTQGLAPMNPLLQGDAVVEGTVLIEATVNVDVDTAAVGMHAEAKVLATVHVSGKLHHEAATVDVSKMADMIFKTSANISLATTSVMLSLEGLTISDCSITCGVTKALAKRVFHAYFDKIEEKVVPAALAHAQDDFNARAKSIVVEVPLPEL